MVAGMVRVSGVLLLTVRAIVDLLVNGLWGLLSTFQVKACGPLCQLLQVASCQDAIDNGEASIRTYPGHPVSVQGLPQVGDPMPDALSCILTSLQTHYLGLHVGYLVQGNLLVDGSPPKQG